MSGEVTSFLAQSGEKPSNIAELLLGKVKQETAVDRYLKEKEQKKNPSISPSTHSNTEERVLGEGLRYNKGKIQWTLMNFPSFEPMIKVLMFGAEKYARDNWKGGLSKNEVLDSLLRHVVGLMKGEVNDPESSLPHIGHLMCNAMFYSYFTIVNTENARD